MKPDMTRQAAIAAKCRDCTYDPLSKGTWKEQVAECACSNCPLHSFRPVPRYEGMTDRTACIDKARRRLAA